MNECRICGKEAKLIKCDECGGFVCDDCFEKCDKCSSKVCIICDLETCDICGDKICRMCESYSGQPDLVICDYCCQDENLDE